MDCNVVIVKHRVSSQYVHLVSLGLKWFSMSACGTRADVLVPSISRPKLRLQTIIRAHSKSRRLAICGKSGQTLQIEL